MIDTNKLSRMGRRRFMDKMKELGFSSTLIAGLSQEELTNLVGDLDSEVPHLKSYRHTNPEEVKNGKAPKREKHFVRIPKDEWVDYRTAQSARARVAGKIQQYDLIDSSIASKSESKNAEMEISVSYIIHTSESGRKEPSISKDKLRSIVPSKVEGTVNNGKQSRTYNVTTQEEHPKEQAYFNDKYRPIPGGCQIEKNDYSNGTTACEAYSYDDQEYVMMTAGHVAKNQQDDELAAELHQPSTWGSNKVGSGKYDVSGDRDCGYIKRYSSYDGGFSSDIAGKDGTYRNLYVRGTYSKDELDRKNSEGETLMAQGRTTGSVESMIWKTDTEDIYLYWDSNGGDSGGPYYGPPGGTDEGDIYMAGIHFAAVGDDWEKSKGNQMSKIEEWLNVNA